MLQGDRVRVNGAPERDAKRTIEDDDRVEIASKSERLDPRVRIIFEDDDLIVINKPAGLVVHPGAGHRGHTLVNALLHHCPGLSEIGGKERPGIVHRLDKETSGCLVVAKNDRIHRALSDQFAARTVDKKFWGARTVSVIDTDSNRRVRDVTVGVRPNDMALARDGRSWHELEKVRSARA